MVFAEIQQKILKAKELDFGTIFNQSIELFKKVWVQGLLMLLITMLLVIPFILIFYIPLLFAGLADATRLESLEGVEPILIVFIVMAYILLILGSSVIGFALQAAFYRICKQKNFNDNSADDYFYFLKKPYLGKTIKISLAYLGISLLAALLCFFPLIYAIVPLGIMVVVYAFNPDLSISNIIKASFNLGNKKWLLTFGLIFVAGLLAQLVGLLMCLIGIFVTASFSLLPVYFIYKEVIGFNEESEIKQS